MTTFLHLWPWAAGWRAFWIARAGILARSVARGALTARWHLSAAPSQAVTHGNPSMTPRRCRADQRGAAGANTGR